MATRNSVQLHVALEENGVISSISNIQKAVNSVAGKQYTIEIKLKGATPATINKRADALKNLADQIQVITGQSSQAMTNVQALGEVTKQLGTNANNAKKGLTVLGSSLDKAKKKSQQLTEAEKERNRAVAEGNRILSRAQSIITGFAVAAYVAGIRSALVELRNVDTELVTIQKVTGQTRQEVQALADESYTTAAKYGAIASDYLSSVASFARAGYQENAKALGELSLMTQKVGDVDAKTADQFLLSVDAAYQYKGSIQELTKVLDGANEIGNKFATDVNKITAGLGIVSNVAKQANVDIDEVTAALGTITAVTQRSGSEAARALRAIYLNIAADISTEFDEDTGDHWTAEEVEAMATSLQKFGIYTRYVKDGMEQLRNPMEVIGEIAEKVKSGMISEVELNDLLQGLGGKLRSNQLLALINNWDMYTSMLDTYRTAAGSAEEELGIYLDSWEAKAAKLQATWTELVNKSLNSDTIKRILDAGTAILEVADNLGIFTTALGGLLILLNSNKIATGISNFGTMLGGIFGGTGAVGAGVAATGWIGAAIVAVSLLAAGITYFNKTQDEARQKAIELSNGLETERLNAEKLYTEYKEFIKRGGEANTVQSEIEGASKRIAQAYGVEESTLDNLVKVYGDYSTALDVLIKQRAQLQLLESGNGLDASFENLARSGIGSEIAYGFTDYARSENGVATYTNRAGSMSTTVDARQMLEWYYGLRQEQDRLFASGEALGQQYLDNQEKLNKYKAEVEDYSGQLENQIHLQFSATHGAITSQEELEEYIAFMHERIDASDEVESALEDIIRSEYDFADALQTVGGNQDDANRTIASAKEILSEYAETLSAIESEYTTLTTAVEEYNKNGAFTAATFKSLVDNNLLQYLDEVDGKLVINEQALLNDADAARAKAEEDIRAAWAADLLAFAEGRVSQMSAGGQTAVANFASSIKSAGDEAAQGASGFLTAAAAIETTRNVLEGDKLSNFNAGVDAINAHYEGLINQLSKVKFVASTSGRGGGGGGSSRSSAATEKANTYIEVLKAMLDDADFQVEQWTRDGGKEDAIIAMYERMMREIESVREKYLAEGYDETSDEIQELTKLWWKYADAIEDIHEDIAKQVQNTWDELDNAIDAEIDALKEARDLEEDQLDLEEKRLAVLEAEQALLDARNDRSVRKYNADGSWEWVADERNLQSAQEAYDKARETYDKALQDKEYADLEAEWEAIKKAIEEPGRDIAEILNDIATIGTPAMKEQVDNITSLLGKLGYDIAVVGAAKSGGVTSADSAQINKLLTGDYSGATFDNGGVAGIKGIMLKNTQDAETVLPPSLTKAIISPQRNAQFSTFTDALTKMFGMAEYRASGAGSITRNYGNTDSHDTTYTVNGVQIGWAQAQRPFYEVMRDIVVYTNPN